MEKVPNPYFSVEISEHQINHLRSRIQGILGKEIEVEFQILENPHISISYFLGDVNLQDIEQVAEEIVEAPFKMTVCGIDPVESNYYGGTIISLGLKKSDDFLYCQEYLKESLANEENIKIKEYKGGFIAHVSLFVIKGLSEKDKFYLSRYLEICLADVGGTEVFGEKFCMYNPDRVKLIEKQFLKQS